jgi:hypothetical protein
MFAKELLLQCMVKSVSVLEGVLDGFLAISTDISQTAKALGPSPSTYAYLKGTYFNSISSIFSGFWSFEIIVVVWVFLVIRGGL